VANTAREPPDRRADSAASAFRRKESARAGAPLRTPSGVQESSPGSARPERHPGYPTAKNTSPLYSAAEERGKGERWPTPHASPPSRRTASPGSENAPRVAGLRCGPVMRRPTSQSHLRRPARRGQPRPVLPARRGARVYILRSSQLGTSFPSPPTQANASTDMKSAAPPMSERKKGTNRHSAPTPMPHRSD